MISLREYQDRGVAEIRSAYQAGQRRILYQLATGGGKTVIFCYIAHGAVQKGNRVMVLAHRSEIIRQICRALDGFQVPHGVIAAGRQAAFYHPTQVASVMSVRSRLGHIPAPDLIIIDECHHATSKSYRDILAAFPNARVLGVSATPQRLDGAGLGDIFGTLIQGPSVQSLIDAGYLTQPIYYAPPIGVDTSKLHSQGGDFNKHEVGVLMDRPTITGSAVEHYTRICGGKSAIAFCASLKHAEHVAAEFNAVGYRAACIDGKLDDKTRQDRTEALGDGRIHVLCSVDLVSEGFDLPAVTAAIKLRPTESLALDRQQTGRVLRVSPGKDRAIIIDHVGNLFRHGLAEDEVAWTLDAAKRRPKAAAAAGVPYKQCKKCYAIFLMAVACPQCGHVVEIKVREVDQVDGTLQEITRDQVAARRAQWEIANANGRDELRVIARARGYEPGWVDSILRIRAKRELAKRIEDAKQGTLI